MMEQPRVLVTAPRAVAAIERYRVELSSAGFAVDSRPVTERLEEEDLLPLVGGIDGIICGDDRLTERVLAAAPRLRVISKWGTGIDSIDLAAAARRGILVRNTPDAFSDAVADSVMGYLLLFARRLDRMSADVREGRWERLPLVTLAEMTLGIVGLGSIGRAVARRARAFGMRILTAEAKAIPDTLVAELGLEVVPLERLLTAADAVTLHVPLTPETTRLLNAERLALMQSSAVLINTARGGLIDEPALISRLESGGLAGAALDVFATEPLPENSPLRRLPNVYLAPHNANASPAAAERVHAAAIRNLIEGLRMATR